LTFNPEDEGHLRRWNSEEVKIARSIGKNTLVLNTIKTPVIRAIISAIIGSTAEDHQNTLFPELLKDLQLN
jgi:hypothetical protein